MLTFGDQELNEDTIPQNERNSDLFSGFFKSWNAIILPSFGKILTTLSPLTNSELIVAPANSTFSLIVNLSVLSFKFFFLTKPQEFTHNLF